MEFYKCLKIDINSIQNQKQQFCVLQKMTRYSVCRWWQVRCVVLWRRADFGARHAIQRTATEQQPECIVDHVKQWLRRSYHRDAEFNVSFKFIQWIKLFVKLPFAMIKNRVLKMKRISSPAFLLLRLRHVVKCGRISRAPKWSAAGAGDFLYLDYIGQFQVSVMKNYAQFSATFVILLIGKVY